MKIIAGKSIYKDGKELTERGILVEDGTISKIDFLTTLKEQFPFAEVINCDGFIYPAFFDSHIHLGELSLLLSSIDGGCIKSLDDLKNIAKAKREEPVYIYNLDFNNLSAPDWVVLFKIPLKIFIQSRDEHSIFVSKAFLEEKGIQLWKVPGGELKRYNGQFTGIFKDNAIDLVRNIKEREISKADFENTENYLLQRGITAVTNFDFQIYPLVSRLYRDSELMIRIVQGLKKEFLPDIIKKGIRTGDGGDKLRFGPIKCFMDGSLGSQTARMKESAPFRGILTMEREELREIISIANSNGLQVAVHAIGDEAVKIVLEEIKCSGIPHLRNRVEHLQFFDKEDLPLLKEAPFVPSMQPAHILSDYKILKKILRDRLFSYAWNTVHNCLKTLAFGSDAPVEDASPIRGIYAATSRIPDGVEEPFQDEECISREEALGSYTYGSSFANFIEKELGKIEEGYQADLVVLKKSLFNDMININEVNLTMSAGRVIWMK